MVDFSGVATVGVSVCRCLFKSVVSLECFGSLVPCSRRPRNGGVCACDVLGNCFGKKTLRVRSLRG